MLTAILGGLIWDAIFSEIKRAEALRRRIALLAKRTKVPPEAQGPADTCAARRNLQLLNIRAALDASKARNGVVS